MDTTIHAVDMDRIASEGQTLAVRGARVDVTVHKYDGLPLGEPRDQLYLELTGESWDGPTKSVLTARLHADELQRIVDLAAEAGMVNVPVNQRVVELVKQLNSAVENR